jgi:hypothetical protein
VTLNYPWQQMHNLLQMLQQRSTGHCCPHFRSQFNPSTEEP